MVLGVAVGTTAENIFSRDGSNDTMCGKRKFSTI